VFSPDGKMFLADQWNDGKQDTHFWDVATGKRLAPPLPHPDRITEVLFSPDGKTLLTHCADSKDRIWNLPTRQLIGGPFPGSLSVEFSRDGKILLLGFKETTARLWDVASRQFIGQPLPHEETILAAAFGPDGKTVLTGCGKVLMFGGRGSARLWELPAGRASGTALAHPGDVTAAAFSPNGKTVLTACADAPMDRDEARLWDVAGGVPIGKPVHSKGISGVAFGPDGKTFLTAGRTGIQSWDVATAKLQAPTVADNFSGVATLSSDGKTLLDRLRKSVVLWDIVTGERLGEFRPPTFLDWIDAAALSSDGC
jgi:eukaryotic-like serine/threonine-protein kinase